MVTIKGIKIQKNDKNFKKISKNTIDNKKMLERFSDEPSNYPRCVLWQRCWLGLDFWISMRETNLGWVFSGIGSPSASAVRRDERESVKIVV